MSGGARRVLRDLVRGACVVSTIACLASCAAQHVEFTDGRCLIEGQPTTLGQVEAKQAALSERILHRQPLFVLVTILIVVLAGASHVEKLVVLFSTRGVEARGLGDRLRAVLDRYRAHPLRYFSIVGATLVMLGLAGGCYVYLDADKRASERALGLLQFCHLALRDSEAQAVLDEQRRNLDTIEATAGSIRALVDKLPPDEKQKAEEIVARINAAIGRQGKLMGDYLAKSDESMKAIESRTAAVERGIATLDTAIVALKSIPSDVKDGVELDKQLGRQLASLDGRAEQEDRKLAALQGAVKDLLARPERACPACVCQAEGAATRPPVTAPPAASKAPESHPGAPIKDAPASAR